MNITKDQFQQWKEDDVTKAFMEAASERVMDAKDILATQAGLDPTSDNFYRGFVAAYEEMKDFRIDFDEED